NQLSGKLGADHTPPGPPPHPPAPGRSPRSAPPARQHHSQPRHPRPGTAPTWQTEHATEPPAGNARTWSNAVLPGGSAAPQALHPHATQDPATRPRPAPSPDLPQPLKSTALPYQGGFDTQSRGL